MERLSCSVKVPARFVKERRQSHLNCGSLLPLWCRQSAAKRRGSNAFSTECPRSTAGCATECSSGLQQSKEAVRRVGRAGLRISCLELFVLVIEFVCKLAGHLRLPCYLERVFHQSTKRLCRHVACYFFGPHAVPAVVDRKKVPLYFSPSYPGELEGVQESSKKE